MQQTRAQPSWVTLLQHLRSRIRCCREREPMKMSMRSRRAGKSRDAAVGKSSGLRPALDGTCHLLILSSRVAADDVARIASSRAFVKRSTSMDDTWQ